jgi:hypothetical protein
MVKFIEQSILKILFNMLLKLYLYKLLNKYLNYKNALLIKSIHLQIYNHASILSNTSKCLKLKIIIILSINIAMAELYKKY